MLCTTKNAVLKRLDNTWESRWCRSSKAFLLTGLAGVTTSRPRLCSRCGLLVLVLCMLPFLRQPKSVRVFFLHAQATAPQYFQDTACAREKENDIIVDIKKALLPGWMHHLTLLGPCSELSPPTAYSREKRRNGAGMVVAFREISSSLTRWLRRTSQPSVSPSSGGCEAACTRVFAA